MRSGVPVSSYNSRSGGAGAGVSGLTTADGGDAIADNEVIRGDGTTGIQGSPSTLTDSGNLSLLNVGGEEKFRLFSTTGALTLGSDGHIIFVDNPDASFGAADVGIKRAAAGRLKVTNGGAGAGALDVGNLRLGTSTLSSTDTNGSILLDPDGTGNVQIVSGLLQLLGSTSSFPALKRSGVGVEIRLADDSSYGTLTIRTGPPGLFFGGTGATNAAVRTTAAAVPLLEFVTATESAYANIAAARLTLGGTTVGLFTGAGTPEGAVTAGIGSIFLRTDGGAGTSAYIKESGTGNTGWKALVGV